MSDDETESRCKALWADLEAWRAPRKEERQPNTIAWVVWHYRNDPLSPFHKKRHRTKRSYDHLCNKLEIELGARTISRITGEDVLGYYETWTKVNGPSAARHTGTMLRTLAKYAVIKGVPGAKDFKELITDNMEFPVQPPRSVAPTRDEVRRIVNQAERDGYLSIAIATQAQFDLIERRTHIIGYWEDDQWRPGWVWQNIRDWVITYSQNKVGLVPREYDLRDTPRLLELLQKIPENERIGPVIKCERQRGNKAPWTERHYADVFREICRRAGVRDEIKSMDMRAGGATEADAIPEVSDRDLKAAGGWKSDAHNRYTRAPQRRAARVVQLRQKAQNET